VPLGGTAAGRSEAVSFAQNRFGFGQTNAPERKSCDIINLSRTAQNRKRTRRKTSARTIF